MSPKTNGTGLDRQEPLKHEHRVIDFNCDMGEGLENDALIMPFISSANIACGYHAGDASTMWDTIELAAKHQVAIGAHVSFFDRENFGRKEIKLDAEDIYELVEQQLIICNEIADSFNLKLHHVKPHGALYNISARSKSVAKAIAAATKDFDESLILYGLSNSHSIAEARAIGLKTASEVFADRTYQDDGSLTHRSEPHALIEDPNTAIAQVLQMIETGNVISASGKKVPIVAETVCIHGDGLNAADFAERIFNQLQGKHIAIKAI